MRIGYLFFAMAALYLFVAFLYRKQSIASRNYLMIGTVFMFVAVLLVLDLWAA